jgi:hypothetical protein
VDGLRRSPGFASEDAKQLAIGPGPGIRNLQTAFPGVLPVDGCDFLAYSCAAARELHPLPCLCRGAKTRKPKDISKNGKSWCQEFIGWGQWKSNRGRVEGPSRSDDGSPMAAGSSPPACLRGEPSLCRRAGRVLVVQVQRYTCALHYFDPFRVERGGVFVVPVPPFVRRSLGVALRRVLPLLLAP